MPRHRAVAAAPDGAIGDLNVRANLSRPEHDGSSEESGDDEDNLPVIVQPEPALRNGMTVADRVKAITEGFSTLCLLCCHLLLFESFLVFLQLITNPALDAITYSKN